jgi:leucyl aminopeptidase
MYSIIHKLEHLNSENDIVLIGTVNSLWSIANFTDKEMKYLMSKVALGDTSIQINQYDRWVFVECIEDQTDKYKTIEKAREIGAALAKKCNNLKLQEIQIVSLSEIDFSPFIAEGMALANYQFLKYFKDSEAKCNSLSKILIDQSTHQISHLNALVNGTLHARDLVNEPLSFLTALQFSKEISILGVEAGFSVEVLHKKQIESLKMGGLLAVNKGAVEPPTFNVLTYTSPEVNQKPPIVLVGKGIVYDTGGLSLKPTANSMDMMKCDMGGAASVVGIMYAIAKAKLPVHVVGLIPATENRPGGNAYAPGDVITMMDGTTVEVLNTDAEGRLVMADALVYAKKYEPELVIDFATLTGAAVRAIGKYGIVAMGNADKVVQNDLCDSGANTYERLALMPFWDEYATLLKSDIADMTNLGPAEAGQITAGKFLEHFTSYPWMHFDIAGPAYLSKDDHYRPKGATGVGVRILFDYLSNKVKV